MARVCIFCNLHPEALTREHVYGNWISEFFQARYGKQMQGKVELVDSDGNINDFGMVPFQHTIKMVCHACNHGWMNSLEIGVRDHLKAMMTGDPRFLDADAQRRLAFWCSKTALVIDCLQPKSKVIPESHYGALYAQQSALPTQVVLVGRRSMVVDDKGTLLGGAMKQPIVNFKAPAGWTEQDTDKMRQAFLDGHKVYKVTFMVGEFVALVFGYDLPTVLQVQSPKPVAKPIWPIQPGFYWDRKLNIDKIGGVPGLHMGFGPGPDREVTLPASLARGHIPDQAQQRPE
jgi:hypothetical protein